MKINTLEKIIKNKQNKNEFAIVTNLSTGDLYSASIGKGAFKNDKQISVHKEEPLYKIVGINISPVIFP